MKLTIIGHFCFDIFHRSNGTEEKIPGGIFHSIAAMANLASDRDIVFPIFGVSEKDLSAVQSAFSKFKNIDLTGIFTFSGETNTVHYDDDSPNERSLNIAKPIPFSHIKKYLNVDGVLVNMISGNDITVDTIDEIRLEIRGKKTPIHLDIHCLTMNVREDGTRNHHPMVDWRRWCFMTDSVQMNEEEAAEISLEHFSDELLAKQMIPLMVKAFVITRGKNGATMYQEEHKQLITTEFKNEQQNKPVSTLGSGDIFGSAMLYSFLKKKNYSDSVTFAQQAASQCTAFSLSEKHQHLRTMRELL